MNENNLVFALVVTLLCFLGGVFYMGHQTDLLKQETIRTLVSQGVPALEASCAINQRN